MNTKQKPIKLSETEKKQLIEACINYLESLLERPLNPGLKQALLADGTLRPKWWPLGTFLLESESTMTDAHFMEEGLAILFNVHPKTGIPKIFYIWEEGSIIVLYQSFIEKLPVGDYYIQLLEDAKMVSISNFKMDGIYDEHSDAYILTQKILSLKTQRRMLQTDILLMDVKAHRPAAFDEKFPKLKGRLTREQICAFIGVRPTTLDGNK